MTTLQWTIIESEEKDKPVWRYLTANKFIDLLESSEIFLCKLDKFIDEYEGKLNQCSLDNMSYLFRDFPNSVQMQNHLSLILKNLRNNTFTNCWHINQTENLEMWKTYCGSTDGVVIKTNINNLVSSILFHDFGPMHFRPVQYGQRDISNIDLSFPLELINFKDEIYRFENEYRISLIYTKGSKSIEEVKEFEELMIIPPEKGLKLKVDLDTLIQDVIISPFASDDFKEKIEELCKMYLKLKPINSNIKIV